MIRCSCGFQLSHIDDACPVCLPHFGGGKSPGLTDVELAALTALVAHETATMNAEVQKYGELQSDPYTPALEALREELERRKVVGSAQRG